MKIVKFPLHLFEEKEPNKIHTIIVPEGSVLLSIKVIHDGIYAWYKVSELVIENTQKDEYIILSPEQTVPEGAEFIDVLDTIFENAQGQGIVIFPIFKLKSE